MTPKVLREIAQAMQEFGLLRVKMGDVEIESGGSIGNAKFHVEQSAPKLSSHPTIPNLPTDSNPIEHKVEQLASLMKLGDVALVDALFPDHTEQSEESA